MIPRTFRVLLSPRIFLYIAGFFISPHLWGSPPLGLPGSSDRALAVRAGMGLGYTILELEGEKRDQLRRLEIAMPKLSLFVSDFVEIGGTLLGLAYTRRATTDYRGLFGFGGEGYVRVYPLLQNENAGINLALEAGYSHRENEGIRTRNSKTEDDLLLQRTAHVALFMAYRGDIWGAFGGFVGKRSWVYQRREGSTRKNLVPVGAFFGLDFFVTPLIFFSMEFHTFEENTLFLGVGANLTP